MPARLPFAPLALVAVALVLLAPAALADVRSGSSAGLNLGIFAPGLWEVYAFEFTGSSDVALTWPPSALFPFADYDLHLYRPGAYADGYLEEHELLRASAQHPYAHHAEGFSHTGAAGIYYLAVVPFQAQMETYTLSATPGGLDRLGRALGYTQE